MQHDNAPPHASIDDAEDVAAGYLNKRTSITLEAQPPNSPDPNILDLELFAGIQSLQFETTLRRIEELIQELKEAYEKYSPQSIDKNFLTLLK